MRGCAIFKTLTEAPTSWHIKHNITFNYAHSSFSFKLIVSVEYTAVDVYTVDAEGERWGQKMSRLWHFHSDGFPVKSGFGNKMLFEYIVEICVSLRKKYISKNGQIVLKKAQK